MHLVEGVKGALGGFFDLGHRGGLAEPGFKFEPGTGR